MSAVFAKTPKGQEEIASKAGGLSPRERRILIFADGKRTIDEIRELVRSDDLQHTLGRLEEAGYIELASSTAKAPAGTPQTAITAFRELPAELEPVKFQQSRNFMLNTLATFVGPLGASGLSTRIEQAQTPLALRELFSEWFYAIVMTREGRREAETLRAKLLEII